LLNYLARIFKRDPKKPIGKQVFALHNTQQMNSFDSITFVPRFIIICVLSVTQSACAPLWGYGPDRQTQQEFTRRVETAFRLQNRMTSEVMLLQSEDAAGNNHEFILKAEQEMHKKCKPLNEYASKEIDGESNGIFFLQRVENAIADCEIATKALQDLLTHQ
jgi:hypothetical protein